MPAPGFGSQPTLEFSTFQRVGRRDPGERTRPACYMATPESGKSLRNARGNSPTSRGVATELPRQAEAAPWQPEFGPPQEVGGASVKWIAESGDLAGERFSPYNCGTGFAAGERNDYLYLAVALVTRLRRGSPPRS